MKSKMAKISVIIPVYNAEQYLCRCIDNVLRQTYTDFELILVNDGNTDSSSIILDEYSKMDHRIRVIYKKTEGIHRPEIQVWTRLLKVIRNGFLLLIVMIGLMSII